MDFGLLRTWEKGKFGLRPKMKFRPFYYYIAVLLNFTLRWFWTLSLIPSEYVKKIFFSSNVLGFIEGLAEMIRRTQWAIIRTENENLNNFEKYRQIL